MTPNKYPTVLGSAETCMYGKQTFKLTITDLPVTSHCHTRFKVAGEKVTFLPFSSSRLSIQQRVIATGAKENESKDTAPVLADIIG